MEKVKRILVPVDFSKRSREGLRFAASLAEEFGAGLVVLYVLSEQRFARDLFTRSIFLSDGPGAIAVPKPLPVDKLLEDAALDLYRFIESTLSPGQLARLKPVRKLAIGKAREEVPRVAIQEKADLIVLASSEPSFISRAFTRDLGSFLAWRAPCSVLFIGKKGEWLGRYKGILRKLADFWQGLKLREA
jgi:nucleotide-binding universal stress UspA family protein